MTACHRGMRPIVRSVGDHRPPDGPHCSPDPIAFQPVDVRRAARRSPPPAPTTYPVRCDDRHSPPDEAHAPPDGDHCRAGTRASSLATTIVVSPSALTVPPRPIALGPTTPIDAFDAAPRPLDEPSRSPDDSCRPPRRPPPSARTPPPDGSTAPILRVDHSLRCSSARLQGNQGPASCPEKPVLLRALDPLAPCPDPAPAPPWLPASHGRSAPLHGKSSSPGPQ